MSKETFFETIKCNDFEIFNLSYHNKRLANTIGMNINLQDYIYPPSNKLLKCKVTYTENEVLNVEFSSYIKREIKSFQLIYDDNISYSKKSTNRDSLNSLSKKKNNTDEIIIIKNSLITDTSIANIAIFDGSNWITPKIPLLKGTTRARLLNEQMIFEKDITVTMLKNAQRFALLNAMIGFDILDDYSFFE